MIRPRWDDCGTEGIAVSGDSIQLAEPADVLAKIPAGGVAELNELLSAAASAEHEELLRAIDEVLGVLPRLTRPAARKILFGGQR